MCKSLFLALLLTTAAAAQPLVHEGLVTAPCERVWEAFTTTEGVKRWMAPLADANLKIGGKLRANYDPQATLGDAQTIENTILSYDPQRMLSFRATKAPAGFPYPVAIKDMWTVVYFQPEGANTRVRITCHGFNASPESQKMRAFFDRGNGYTLLQLQTLFKQP